MVDYKPFVVSSLFSPAKTKPKDEDQVCEDSNVSLDLSLSLDYMSSAATTTDNGKKGIDCKEEFEVWKSNINDQNERKEHTMKKNSGGFSSEPSDMSLELSLSVSGDNSWVSKGKSPIIDEGNQSRFEVGECSNRYHKEEHNYLNDSQKLETGVLSLELSLGLDDTCTSKKRKIMENTSSTRKVSSNRNKRSKVEREEDQMTELRLGRDLWCIKKQLFGSDLGNNSRLLLASDDVEIHVFEFWNDVQLSKIKKGLPVSVWDYDTNTEHKMVFKQWNNGANVLIKNWVKDFVKRRELKLGDEIGLFWDKDNSRFNFSVRNRAARG
ncbi:hypothetical protein REPUB_Repub09cG0203900 [Reevesia pubescens]